MSGIVRARTPFGPSAPHAPNNPDEDVRHVLSLSLVNGLCQRMPGLNPNAIAPVFQRGGAHVHERLEFLGDAVLELVVVHELVNLLSRTDPGKVQALRTHLLCNTTLSAVARSLSTMQELPTRGRHLFADALEAMVGSVYQATDYRTAAQAIKECILAANVDPPATLPEGTLSTLRLLRHPPRGESLPGPRRERARTYRAQAIGHAALKLGLTEVLMKRYSQAPASLLETARHQEMRARASLREETAAIYLTQGLLPTLAFIEGSVRSS